MKTHVKYSFLKLLALLLTGAIFLSVKPIFARADGEWETLSSYTTYFNAEEKNRVQNVTIAAGLISGVTIQPYGEFSFNQTVGRRTQEAGFRQAKIIVNGEYVQGVGGGVCQVSTTLYNAALKSGLTVTEYHPHPLAPHHQLSDGKGKLQPSGGIQLHPRLGGIGLSGLLFL